MKAQLKITQTNIEGLKEALNLQEVEVTHAEFDKLVIKPHPIGKTKEEAVYIWHRNLIFEAEGVRIMGFVFYNGLMGHVECELIPGGPDTPPAQK